MRWRRETDLRTAPHLVARPAVDVAVVKIHEDTARPSARRRAVVENVVAVVGVLRHDRDGG